MFARGADQDTASTGADINPLPFGFRRPDFGRHLPALDGVRGLAVLMVLVFHFIGTTHPTNGVERIVTSLANYGSYGVELFFILSGFLITGILIETRSQPGYFRNFYMRRTLRIFPLYYGVLVVLFLIAPLIPALRGDALGYLQERQAWAWLYGVNVYIAKEGTWSLSYINHFWSLAVEEHFYLFWPLVVFAVGGRPQRLMAICLGIVVCAFAGRLIGLLAGMSWWSTYVLTPFRLDGLALGGLLAVAARQPNGWHRLARAMPVVAAVAFLILAVTATRLVSQLGPEFVQLIRAGTITALLACLLLWGLLAPERSPIRRGLCSPAMMFLGTYSYGIYVYHHFISHYLTEQRSEAALTQWLGSHALAVAVQAGLGIAASIGIAYVSYEVYEKRFLDLKRHFAPRSAGEPSAPRVEAGDRSPQVSQAR